jgi:hypothetical protein
MVDWALNTQEEIYGNRLLQAVLRTGRSFMMIDESRFLYVGSSWQQHQHQNRARRVAAGRRRKSAESLN